MPFVFGVLVVAGCQWSRPADVLPDAATDAPADAPTDAPPDVVIGFVGRGHRTSTGVVDEGIDATSQVIKALIPDAQEQGGFRTILATARTDGTFEIRGVPPDTEYILKVGTRYYVTTAHFVKIRSVVPTRAGVAIATQSTPITVERQTLPGGWPVNDVALYSLRTGVVSYVQPSGPAPSAWTGDWWTEAAGFYQPDPLLPSQAAGDDLQLLSLHTDFRHRQAAVTSIAGVLSVVDATVVDGAAKTITGQLTAPTATFAANLSAGSPFVLASGYGADMAMREVAMSVHAMPALGAQWSPIGGSGVGPPIAASVVSADERLPPPVLTGTFPDPFPPDWPRVGYFRYVRSRTVAVPGLVPARIAGGTYRMFTLPQSPGAPAPLVPPTTVTVNGRAGSDGGGIVAVGAPISVAWTPSPSARQYVVSVFRLTATSTSTVPRFAGAVITTGTMVRIPPELFAGGEYFAFGVTAFQGTNDLAGGELYPDGVPAASAAMVTAAFRLSPTCGNGTMDVGEACDPGVTPTAVCDTDCTLPVCGDGVRNPAAGEACDPMVDAPGCDSDCSPVVCGDGHVNADVEDCDDGNTVDDGNGCTNSCRFNGTCGDSVVQAQSEACDRAATPTTCDADCTLTVCGDATVNPQAGEQCDDGDVQPNDGCSTTCQLE